jgi:aspartyl-tRNA(Asn)/glutamyl-tRNA(Gln) amidotransferase subunit B
MVEEQGLSDYMAGVIVADPLMAALFDRAVELGAEGTVAAGARSGARAAGITPVAIANWVTGDLARLANADGLEFDSLPFGPEHLVDLLRLVETGKISGKMAKDLLEECWRAAGSQPGAGGGTTEGTGRGTDRGTGRGGEHVGADGTADEAQGPERALRSPMPSELARSMGLEQVSDEGQVAEVVAGVLNANAEAVASYRAGKDKAFGFLVGQVMKATRGRANPGLVNRLVREALGDLGGGAGA